MERIPCSMAFLAASSAAICAAKGVDLREPLKPRTPADDHATTFPDTSVMVTTVLLNVDWMWAIPLWTFFLTFFFLSFLVGAAPVAICLTFSRYSDGPSRSVNGYGGAAGIIASLAGT